VKEAEEFRRDYRKSHAEVHHNFQSYSNIIRIFLSTRMSYVVCVMLLEKYEMRTRLLVGKLEGKTPLGTPRNIFAFIVYLTTLSNILEYIATNSVMISE
jgi:hypothetical protein